ncbi:MAG TPA: hypothetical protein VJ765_10640 [Chitinophagaceae bacterium]|nr:hypothetical protein [Chitinophagaceae bacterium]
MNIKTALLKEHSKKQCDAIVKYVGKNPDRFAELMKCFFEGEYRVTQRAAWPMSYCAQNCPELIRPYYKKLLNNLNKPGLHDSIPRNTMRLLQYVRIPEKFHGQVMDICFRYISSPGAAVAIKAFSISVLQNLAKRYPGIINELKLIIEERWDYETIAFKTRAGKLLKALSLSSI